MHPIQYECPHCQAINTGGEALHGQRVTCQKCQATILVPDRPAGAEPQTARLLPGPAARALFPPAEPEQEIEVFHLSPVARTFSGQILLGLTLLGFAVGLEATTSDFIWASGGAILFGTGLLLLVWIKVKSSSYRLTTQRLIIRRGWLARQVDELELYRVKDVVVSQGVLQRLLGYGTISVLADDDTTPRLDLTGMPHPVENKERIRTHYRAARHREGVRPTEFMHSP